MELVSSNYQVSITVPFPSKRQAEIAYDVLRVDEEPKRSAVDKKITISENNLLVHFSGAQAKNVRVGLTAFFDTLILCCETLEQFGPPTSEKYDFY